VREAAAAILENKDVLQDLFSIGKAR